MNVQINEDNFSDESINRFLCGEMNAEQAALIESRMESCEDFAQRVTRLAAHSWDWGVVTCSLVDDEFDDRRDTHRSSHDFSSTATIAAAPTCASEQAGSLLQRELSGWLDPTDDPDMLGRFAGYEIVGVIGHGGMGIVMKGFERALNRFVAIKVLAPRLAGNGAARKRFEREARAAAAVLHDNVISIHRVDQWHGLPFLVMPYVAGESLQQRIDREGPLDLEGTLRIAQQIAAGLAAAHSQGLVHRDIKPANILLDQGVERVTITDFGLARAADDAPITRTGFVTGTPMYMSPEQASAQAIDHRSDLFSLGSVMYSMATGVPPFQADENQSLLGKIRNEPAPDIREKQETVPEWLAELIDWCHAKSPEDRPHSAHEIEDYLGEWIASLKQPQRISTPTRPAIPRTAQRDRRPPRRRNRYVLMALGGALFVLAGIFITLETSKGTISIESEVDGVPIVIKKGEKVYKTLTASRGSNSISVYSGEYQIVITGEPEQVTLENESVTLGWRDKAVVRIRDNKLPAASHVAGNLPSSRLLSPKEALERSLKVVPPSPPASAQGHKDPSKEESIQILVGDEDADKQQYRLGDRIDVYVLASGQNEPAANEKPVMRDVAVVSCGPMDTKRNDGQTSWSGQSIVVNGPTDSVLLAPESELLQDLYRQEKIRFYVRLHDGAKTNGNPDGEAASMWQTTPWMDVMNHVTSHAMRRERMAYGDVEFKLVTSKGDSRSQRQYHVWFNGRNRRADCREDTTDAAENYSRILTPRMNWYYDQQDNSKTKFQKRFPENPVGWDGIIDIRKIGLVNRNFEEMNATGFCDDLQPLDAGPPRVEQSQLDDGQPITIVKMPLWHRWTEYWLSPNHGNAPIYMAKGWSEKDNPAVKHHSTMHTQWKRIDGVWFPTSIKYHHQCEHLNIDESTQFELISANFSEPPSMEIFDPKNITEAKIPFGQIDSRNKGPQTENGTGNRGQAETSGTDHQRDKAKVVDSPCQLKVQVIFIADAAHHLLDEVDGLPAEEVRERVELARFVQDAFVDPPTTINGTRQVTKNLSSAATSQMLSRLVDRQLIEIGPPVLVDTAKTTFVPISLGSLRPKDTSWQKMQLQIQCKDMKDGRLGFRLQQVPKEPEPGVPVNIGSVIRFQSDETAIAPWYFHWLNSQNREQFRKRVGGEQFLLFQSNEAQRTDEQNHDTSATNGPGDRLSICSFGQTSFRVPSRQREM